MPLQVAVLLCRSSENRRQKELRDFVIGSLFSGVKLARQDMSCVCVCVVWLLGDFGRRVSACLAKVDLGFCRRRVLPISTRLSAAGRKVRERAGRDRP